VLLKKESLEVLLDAQEADIREAKRKSREGVVSVNERFIMVIKEKNWSNSVIRKLGRWLVSIRILRSISYRSTARRGGRGHNGI